MRTAKHSKEPRFQCERGPQGLDLTRPWPGRPVGRGNLAVTTKTAWTRRSPLGLGTLEQATPEACSIRGYTEKRPYCQRKGRDSSVGPQIVGEQGADRHRCGRWAEGPCMGDSQARPDTPGHIVSPRPISTRAATGAGPRQAGGTRSGPMAVYSTAVALARPCELLRGAGALASEAVEHLGRDGQGGL